jgi:hypothetical protein
MKRRTFLLLTSTASANLALRPANALIVDETLGAAERIHADGFESVGASTNTAYLFPTGRFEPDSLLPLQRIFPQADSVTSPASHHRRAYPGLRWECPVRAMGGSNPRFYELLSGPPGMRIGEFLERDGTGDYVPTRDYATLAWEAPVAGNYLVRVRCSDQNNRPVLFEFRLQVALDGHLFTAPARLGNGDGRSPANAMAWSDAVLAPGMVSPCRGKVLVCRGGDYVLDDSVLIDGNHMATSLVAYPGEVPVFDHGMQIRASDVFIGGLRFEGVGVGEFGVINDWQYHHRWSVWRCHFERCFNADAVQHNNQSCIGAVNSRQAIGRQHLLMAENTYRNCRGLHAYDFYNVDTHLCERETFVLDDPTIPLTHSIWFPKSDCRFFEISFCRADLPPQSSAVENVIQVYNIVYGTSRPGVGSIEYNFVRGGSNACPLVTNGSADSTTPSVGPITIVCQVRRNSFVGSAVQARHFDRDFGVERHSHFAANVLQTGSNGAISTWGPPNANPVWFTERDSLRAGSGLVDAGGRLVDTTLRGRRGAQVWRPL